MKPFAGNGRVIERHLGALGGGHVEEPAPGLAGDLAVHVEAGGQSGLRTNSAGWFAVSDITISLPWPEDTT